MPTEAETVRLVLCGRCQNVVEMTFEAMATSWVGRCPACRKTVQWLRRRPALRSV